MQSAKKIVESYLVASARLGNKAAWEQLVAKYQARFLRHAFRLLGDTEQAKDAVQESWIEVMRGLSKLKDDMAFRAWAFRIVTRRCAQIIAKQQKIRETAARLAGEPSTITDSTDSEKSQELATDLKPLRAAMATLSAEHRSAIALFYLEEMSVAEVAVALDIPVGTVKSRLLNARAKLRESLERRI